MTRSPIVLAADIYDELHRLVQWQFDSPIEFGSRAIEELSDLEREILSRAGHVTSTLVMVSFDEHFELQGEDENGIVHPITKGVA